MEKLKSCSIWHKFYNMLMNKVGLTVENLIQIGQPFTTYENMCQKYLVEYTLRENNKNVMIGLIQKFNFFGL